MQNNIEKTGKNLIQVCNGSDDFRLSIHDREYNILYQNDTLKEQFGGLGEKCYRVYEGREYMCEDCLVEKVFIDGNSHVAERKVNLQSEEVEYWEKTVHPIGNSQGEIVACLETERNITDRKRIERDILDLINDANEKLRAKSIKLDETNTAIRILLEQREIDKKDHEKSILKNIEILIMPYLEKLKIKSTSPEQFKYINILEENMMQIVSSFSTQLHSDIYSLTPKEVQVCNLIKNGKQSKEIAEIMQISFETVNCHRQNIRKKLGLNHSKVNLKSFISSLSD